MATTLTLALKAPTLAYGPLVYAYYLQGAGLTPSVSVAIDWKPVTLIQPDNPASTAVLSVAGRDVVGPSDCVVELAQLAESSLQGTEAQAWLTFARDQLGPADHRALRGLLDQLDQHLVMRSFMFDHRLTAVDFAVWGILRGNRVFQSQVKAQSPLLGIHLLRWYTFVESQPSVAAALRDYYKAVDGIKNKVDQGKFDIPLQDAAVGQVVTRFPPEPSGYLHIGHAKAALLNQYFAEKYQGKLIVRFDDTNPSKEKEEFEQSILHDLQLLGVEGNVVTHTSDYFDQIYQYALQMIRSGKAYVDNTDNQTMREERGAGIASKCRDLDVEENLRRFEEMTQGTPFGLTCCLRAKISVDNPNKAMRDPVIYRCNVANPHHITGTKWKVYPTYDFACPIVDSLEGVTHALRTNEYRDRNPQYNWFFDALGIRKVHIWDYSRMNFVHTLLSKRKLQALVDAGVVAGWDDPRFPTVRGIRRRGLTIEALKQYIIMQGASQNILMLEWDKLWAINKKVIDPVAPRHTAIPKGKLCQLTITDVADEPVLETVSKHKKNPKLGSKDLWKSKIIYVSTDDAAQFVEGEEVTLMDWGNVLIQKKYTNDQGVVNTVTASSNFQGDYKKTKLKITWLASQYPQTNDTSLVDCMLCDYDYLITKRKLEEGDDWQNFVNPITEFKAPAVGDTNLRALQQGDIIQLERTGYFICDKAWSEEDPCLYLILIPDGKAGSTTIKAENKA
ncbi:glutamate--tRNA ligase [Dispira simplex]|nr:glutamate--tRNA ligase [Dispira simplex]